MVAVEGYRVMDVISLATSIMSQKAGAMQQQIATTMLKQNLDMQKSTVLTLLGGKPVHGDAEFKSLGPDLPPPMPDWSPVGVYGGYHRVAAAPREGGRPTLRHRKMG